MTGPSRRCRTVCIANARTEEHPMDEWPPGRLDWEDDGPADEDSAARLSRLRRGERFDDVVGDAREEAYRLAGWEGEHA